MDISVRHMRYTIRPIRIGRVIPSNDVDALETAFKANSTIWGGIYNPIATSEFGEVWGSQLSMLQAFDPDIVLLPPGVSWRFGSLVST